MSNSIYNLNKIPSMPERILSALAYFTCGILGIILIILSAFMKIGLKQFVKFNCYQAILVGFIFGFLQLTYDILAGFFQLLGIIPFIGSFINSLFQFVIFYMMGFPILFGMSLLGTVVALLILYLAIFALIGKNPYIPYISDAIKKVM